MDWEQEEEENIIELYIKLLPYIAADFPTRLDIEATLGMPYKITEQEAIKRIQHYLHILDSGENLSEKIKPIIEL